jgi:tetratricopeptide (TPR) repeat protein
MSNVVINRIKGLAVIFTFVCAGLSAQEYNDAVVEYNKGVANFKSNIDSAIIYFENCIKKCELAGDTTEDIKMKTVQVLPDLYYQKAFTLLSVDKKVEESIKASKEAFAAGNKYENPSTIEKTQKLMVQAYSTMGSKFFSANENEKALNAFDSVLMINPNHSKSIYNKALVYKKMNNTVKFEETVDLYISKLNPNNDTASLHQVNKLALDYFKFAGSKANKDNNLADALNLLNNSLKYGTSDDVYYQFASVYNKQKKYDEAAENAQKGLDLATGTPEEKAKFYYELGVAQAGKGETGNACESFKNAMYKPFDVAAKGQRTNMKCK